MFVAIRINDKSKSDTIRVGVILPLSGQYASIGEGIRNAMKLSNNSSTEIQFIFEDDKYDAKTGLSAYRKLVDLDSVDIIVSISSPTIEIIKPLINKNKDIMFILGDELSHDRDNVFQIMPQGTGLFTRLGEEASKRYNTIAVVYAKDNTLFVNNHKLFLEGVASTTVIKEFPVISSSDMRIEAKKVVTSEVDAFTIFVPLESGIKLLKELSKYNNKPQPICDMNVVVVVNQYIEAVGMQSLNKCISVVMANTRTLEFNDEYKKTYLVDSGFATDYGYDVVQIIKKLSSENKNKWIDLLNNNFSYSGVSGDIYFDKNGTRPTISEIHNYIDGKFVKLEE